jgi:hypothetical protein
LGNFYLFRWSLKVVFLDAQTNQHIDVCFFLASFYLMVCWYSFSTVDNIWQHTNSYLV